MATRYQRTVKCTVCATSSSERRAMYKGTFTLSADVAVDGNQPAGETSFQVLSLIIAGDHSNEGAGKSGENEMAN